jgi:hypothetical protein
MMEGVNLRYIVTTFINVTMYLQNNNNMIIKNFKKEKKCLKNMGPSDKTGINGLKYCINTENYGYL